MKNKIDFFKEHQKNNMEIGFATAINKVKDIIDECDNVIDIKIAIEKLKANFNL